MDNNIQNNKVPVLGSIPLIGAAFRYKQLLRTRTNLAFLITPIAFQAANPERAVAVSEHNRAVTIGPEHDLADPDLLGRVYDNRTDLRNALSTSDKNPVTKPQKSTRKKRNAENESTETQSGNPD